MKKRGMGQVPARSHCRASGSVFVCVLSLLLVITACVQAASTDGSSSELRTGCVKWSFTTAAPVYSAAAVAADGQIYAVCEAGKLYSLNPDGTPAWEFDAQSGSSSSPAVGADGCIYFGTAAGRLYCLNPDGSEKWFFSSSGAIVSRPVLNDAGEVIFSSADGNVYCLSPEGGQLWAHTAQSVGSLANSFLASPVVASDGTVYALPVYSPRLSAINPLDGTEFWNVDFQVPSDADNPAYPAGKPVSGQGLLTPAIGPDRTIYVMITRDRNLYAINPVSRQKKWSVDMVAAFEDYYEAGYADRYAAVMCCSDPVTGPDGTIYVSFDDPYLRAVNPDGSPKWAKRLGMCGGFTITVDNSGLIYAASDDGLLHVLDGQGNVVSQFRTAGEISNPVISESGMLVFGDSANKVWAISPLEETDAVAGLHHPADIDGSRKVDLKDMALLAEDWRKIEDMNVWLINTVSYKQGDINLDFRIDYADMQILMNNWLYEY